MNNVDRLAKELAKAIPKNGKTSPYDTQATVKRVDGNTAWVHIPGGVTETPVRLTTSAKKGDVVQVRISGGRAWLYGNATSPPTDDTKAIKADAKATIAEEMSRESLKTAERVSIMVQVAEERVTELESEVTSLEDRVETAEGNITTIESDISSLDTRLDTAEGDITTIESDISSLDTRVDTAEGNITTIESDISSLDTRVDTAEGNITTIESDISEAETDISNLQVRVTDAEDEVEDTLRGLALAQDIIGTLAWITAHSTETTDTEPVSGKTYYIKNPNNTFSIVEDTTGKNPAQEGWYELDSALSNYVASHLALTNNGLTIFNDQQSGSMLLSSGGVIIRNANNDVVGQYGEGAIIGDSNKQHISIKNGRITFWYGDENNTDNAVAYVDNQKLYIPQVVVVDSLEMGNWLWDATIDNHLSLNWIGG